MSSIIGSDRGRPVYARHKLVSEMTPFELAEREAHEIEWRRNYWGVCPTGAEGRHAFTQRNIGRCLTQYTCTLCGRVQDVDSSD